MTILKSDDRTIQLLHANALEWQGVGFLLRGESGSGKSDLSLRLIELGAYLIADDQVLLEKNTDGLIATCPAPIQDKMEVRGVGIISVAATKPQTQIKTIITLTNSIERIPKPQSTDILGHKVTVHALNPFEASAPLKLKILLKNQYIFP